MIINSYIFESQSNPNLITNGTFDTDTSGWTSVNATLSVVSGAMRVADGGSYTSTYQAVTLEVGETYDLSFDFVGKSGARCMTSIGTLQPSSSTYGASQVGYTDLGTYTRTFTASATSYYIGFGSEGSYYIDFDNVTLIKQ